MATLDRILVNIEWEAKYPHVNVISLPKSVSDHNPDDLIWKKPATL
jgi:endonuclease/exonuclease/phosphatase family metal-dependent hydrolase